METSPKTIGQAAPGGPPGGAARVDGVAAAHRYSRDCGCAACTKQRAAWRERSKRSYAGKTGKPMPAPAPAPSGPVGPTVPTVPGVAGANGAPGVSPGPVPWTADIVRPGLALVVPAVEKLDVASLKAEASKISPAAAALVEKKGGWGDPQKTAVIESVAAVTCKWMNRFGVSSEYAPEVALIGSVGAIVTQRALLKSELAEMVAEIKKEKEKNEPKKT